MNNYTMIFPPKYFLKNYFLMDFNNNFWVAREKKRKKIDSQNELKWMGFFFLYGAQNETIQKRKIAVNVQLCSIKLYFACFQTTLHLSKFLIARRFMQKRINTAQMQTHYTFYFVSKTNVMETLLYSSNHFFRPCC